MTKHFLQNIINRISVDCRLKNVEGTFSEYNRKIYIQGKEYDECSYRLVFLVDKGNWFKNSISFYMTINSYSNSVIVEERLGNVSNEIFSKAQVSDIVDYVVEEIMRFQFSGKTKLIYRMG